MGGDGMSGNTGQLWPRGTGPTDAEIDARIAAAIAAALATYQSILDA